MNFISYLVLSIVCMGNNLLLANTGVVTPEKRTVISPKKEVGGKKNPSKAEPITSDKKKNTNADVTPVGDASLSRESSADVATGLTPQQSQALGEVAQIETNSLQLLRQILRECIKMGTDGRIKGTQAQKVRNWALQLDDLVKYLAERPFMLSLNFFCIEIVDKAIKSKFTQLHVPTQEELASVVKRGASAQPRLEDMVVSAKKHAHLVEKLVKNVHEFGVTTTNKVARNIEKFWFKYRMNSVLGWAGVGAATVWGISKLREPRLDIHPWTKDVTQSTVGGFILAGVGAGVVAEVTRFAANKIFEGSAGTVRTNWNAFKNRVKASWGSIRGAESKIDADGYQVIKINDDILDPKNTIGLERQLEELQEMVRITLNPEAYIGKPFQCQRTFLFTGASGCGKTYLAQYLAQLILSQYAGTDKEKMQVRFRQVERFEVTWNWKLIKGLIDEARQQGGIVILFIDEFHLLQAQTQGNPEILSSLLTELTNLNNSKDPNSQIFIIGATNSPDKIDVALTAPGRLKVINFGYPNAQTRQRFFEAHLPEISVRPEEVDVASLVRQTATDEYKQCSFSKLKQILSSVKSSTGIITQKDLQESIWKEVYQFDNTLLADVTAAERQMISAYQAGQAYAHLALASTETLEWVTISGFKPVVKERFDGPTDLTTFTKLNPNQAKQKAFGMIATYNPQEALKLETVAEITKLCKRLVAGYSAQQVLLGTRNLSYRKEDMQLATQIAQTIALNGLRFDDLAQKRQNEIKEEAEHLIRQYEREMHTLFTQNKAKLSRVVEGLDKEITLSGKAVAELIA